MSTGTSHLVEPGVKYFLRESLKQCRELKHRHYTFYYNLGGFILLFSILGTILWFKYKGKLTQVEKAIRDKRDREYIMQKIRSIPQKQESIITNLPKWNE